jgi:hypothetical protein
MVVSLPFSECSLIKFAVKMNYIEQNTLTEGTSEEVNRTKILINNDCLCFKLFAVFKTFLLVKTNYFCVKLTTVALQIVIPFSGALYNQ